MELHHVAIRVKQLETSVDFYETIAQLSAFKRLKTDDGELAFLQNKDGETALELICISQGDTVQAKGLFLCFATNDIEKAHKRATENNFNPSPIITPEPDATYFYVYDPDGVSVQIREYI